MTIPSMLALNDRTLRQMTAPAPSAPTPRSRARALTASAEDTETGKDIYAHWKDLSALASKQAEKCTELYEEFAAKVIQLEDQKNACYIEEDRLKKGRDALEAKKRGLEPQIEELHHHIDGLRADIAQNQDTIRRLEKDKETYDILRWIPFVGLISELVAAIDGTREKLYKAQRELSDKEKSLSALNDELTACLRNLQETQRRMAEKEQEKRWLEEEEQLCLNQRNQASKEMIAWKSREQYYLSLSEDMEHLMTMEASAAEFRKLLQDNPPSFPLETEDSYNLLEE